jgi:predicted transcriptional regulator
VTDSPNGATCDQQTSTRSLTLRLSEDQHERLRRVSFATRRPINALIREAIDGAHFHATGVWCDDCPDADERRAAQDG